MKAESESRLMRKREVAEYLGISERAIDWMLARNQLTRLKFGRSVRIERAEVERLIQLARK